MESNFDLALELLGVGMLTVFFILFIVVFLGNMIIQFVNRYIPQVQTIPTTPSSSRSSTIDPNKMAAIVAAVQIVTDGKGKVVNVEKI